MWNGREWERADVRLHHARILHMSWPRDDGVLLIGGGDSWDDFMTTELVTWDGKTSTVSFSLEYPLL